MTLRLLLDTDIGSDIDDAICLAYLLAQPECELMGITTVTGEPEKRAMIASALCRVAGRNIPIYPGIDKPMVVPQMQRDAQQAVALDKWDHDERFPQGEAISFLQGTIRAHPGEIVLLTIGPLTNVGTLFQKDPEIPSLLKGLVMMCGVVAPGDDYPYTREWNANGDPHATSIVYQALAVPHRSIGLDVTMQFSMQADRARERFQPPLLRPVLDFAEVWFAKRDYIYFHDPLAATTIFDDQICGFERGTVEVELTNEEELGTTRFTHGGPDSPHEVALEVDQERFLEHFFSVFD